MKRPVLITAIVASAIALGFATVTFASDDWSTMFFKKAEQITSVNLADVASVQLGTRFIPTGVGSKSNKTARWFEPSMLEFFDNERQVIFRFERDQQQNMGGYNKDPILLNITLFNPSLPDGEVLKITGTTISKFYPPVDDVSRASAHFAAQKWLPDITIGQAITRTAETNQGRGDNLVSAPPARFLVIHVDPVHKVRVDLYAWQSKYKLEEAQALVAQVAQSVQVTPKLTEMFANVKTVDARRAARHMTAVTTTIAKLKPCGISALDVGERIFSGECAAWLSDDQRYIHVARSLGRVPHPGKMRKISEAPDFAVTPMPPGKPTALIGPPDFQLVMFYWNASKKKWDIDELETSMYNDEARQSPLIEAIAARLTDHTQVYMVSLARYDLQFHDDRVAVAEFLSESDRVSAALRAGSFVTGVKALPDSFGK